MWLYRFFVVPLLWLSPVSAQVPDMPPPESEQTPLPVEKWSPELRVLPTTRFDGLDCQALSRARAETQEEAVELAARKKHCLTQYRTFIPRDGMR